MSPEELERVTTILIMMMEDSGIPIDSKSRLRTYIYHAFNDDRIKFLDKDGNLIGFMIWEVHKNNEKIEIYVSHLVIMKEFKGFNLKKAVTFLKQKYPDLTKLHWDSNRRNKRVEKEGSLALI